MENSRTYHIIGAGIAGLYAAKLIKEKYPLSSIILYEAANKIGGRCASFHDSEFNCAMDNATHVILNKNKYAKQLLGKSLFSHSICFWNFKKRSFCSILSCLPECILSVFNTPHASLSAYFTVFRKLFPFLRLRGYFSSGDLNDILCAPLLTYANDIKYGCIWKGIETENKRITRLIFNKENVSIAPEDKIISAIDSFNYHKVMGGYEFDYNPISNIFFRTSMALTFPKNRKIIGLKNAVSQWIFSSPNYTAVTVSNASAHIAPQDIWKEICEIRQYNSAFLPLHRSHYFPRATIRQDAQNNAKRPNSAKTDFENLFICGDWTMKNHPCCIETALLSARRLRRYF